MMSSTITVSFGQVLSLLLLISNDWQDASGRRVRVIQEIQSTFDEFEAGDWKGLGGFSTEVVVACELIGIDHQIRGRYISEVIGTALSGNFDELFKILAQESEFPPDYTWTVAGEYVARSNTPTRFLEFLKQCPTSEIEVEVLEHALINAASRGDNELTQLIGQHIGHGNAEKILTAKSENIERQQILRNFSAEFGREWAVLAGERVVDWQQNDGIAKRMLVALAGGEEPNVDDIQVIMSDPDLIVLQKLYLLNSGTSGDVSSIQESYQSAINEVEKTACYCVLASNSPTVAARELKADSLNVRQLQLYLRILAEFSARNLGDKEVVALSREIEDPLVRSIFLCVELVACTSEL